MAMVDLGEERAASSDRRRAGLTAAFLVICCALVAPVIDVRLGVSYPVFAIVIALSIAAIVITSVLLWAQARVSRSVPLSVLALGYALSAATMLAYMLFYRGLWPQIAHWLSADDQTSAWLYFEWHAIFVGSAIAYFSVRKRYADREVGAARFKAIRQKLVWIGVALFVMTVPALVWIDGLPKLTVDGKFTPLFLALAVVIDAGALAAIASAHITNRFRALLDLWLSLACLSMFADLTMAMFSRQFAAGWYMSRVSILLAATAVLFVLLFQTANLYSQLAITAERLRSESLTDVLTGLANRRLFDQHFAEVMRDVSRTERPLALLMIDIDNFKAYNDTYGHQAGDDCLRSVATILHDNVGRARDLVARTGGEELAVIMPEVDIIGVLLVAERIRGAVATAAIPQGRGAQHPIVTISIGVAATRDPASTTIDALIASGDRALYRAKSDGRNRVVEARAISVVLGVPDA
jgi:diguanylate cyclase (GGDEF)-like protein